jgi:hypothetical protein
MNHLNKLWYDEADQDIQIGGMQVRHLELAIEMYISSAALRNWCE